MIVFLDTSHSKFLYELHMTSAPGTRKSIYYVHWDDEGNVLENITAQWFPKKSIRNKYITDQMGKSFKSNNAYA